jgi:predicted HAD superfamily Cof-like phosphohydrolase
VTDLPQLVNGYRAAQAIHVAAVLGIADELAAGPRAAADLAGAVDADVDALYRLLRALASIGVFEEIACILPHCREVSSILTLPHRLHSCWR